MVEREAPYARARGCVRRRSWYHANVARTVWDDDDPPTEDAPTHVAKPPPIPPATPAPIARAAPGLPPLPRTTEMSAPSGHEPAWTNQGAGGDDDLSLDDPSDPPRRNSARAGWLCAALASAGLAASTATNLHERARMKADLAAARDEAAEHRRDLFRAQDLLAAVERDRAEKAAAAAQLSQKVAAHDAEREKTDRLIAELKSKVDAKDGEVSSEQNQITVNLVDQILFKSGDAELSPRGKQVLAKVGDVLKKLTDKQIMIGGHTDSRPIHTEQFPSNWELSSARAVNVVRYLQDVVGVDPARLTAAGYSQFHPRGRSLAKNRRIEILLVPAAIAVKKT